MLGGIKKLVGMGEAGDERNEQDAEEGLLGSTLVMSKSEKSNTSEAVPIKYSGDQGMEAFAIWPGEMEIAVPAEWKFGDKVPAQGPHGRLFLELPEGVEPGKTLRYRLKPEPELKVEVPPGAKEGGTLMFERPDGTRIGITVPPGKQPGEQFEVVPPALMVIVPEESKPGDNVIFGMPDMGGDMQERQWLRAKVPENLQLGRYFAARLPPPEEMARQGGSPTGRASGPGSSAKPAE